jgi:hypothetical protein
MRTGEECAGAGYAVQDQRKIGNVPCAGQKPPLCAGAGKNATEAAAGSRRSCCGSGGAGSWNVRKRAHSKFRQRTELQQQSR